MKNYGSGGTAESKEGDIEQQKIDAHLAESQRQRNVFQIVSDFPIITTLSTAAAMIAAKLSFEKSKTLLKLYNSLAFGMEGSYEFWMTYLKVIWYSSLIIYLIVWIFEILVSWDGMRRRTCKCCCKTVSTKKACTRNFTHNLTFWIYSFVHFVYFILLLSFLYIVGVWMVAFAITYCARKMCRGVTGSAEYFINLLSLSNTNVDFYFQAMHFCDHKQRIVSASKWAFYTSLVALFTNINLMGSLIGQRYRIHWGIDVLRSKHGTRKI